MFVSVCCDFLDTQSDGRLLLLVEVSRVHEKSE